MFNKKVLSKIDLGKYTKLNPYKGDIIYDPMGQYKHPGKVTRIPGSSITMKNVPYPVWAQPNVGPGAMMYPEQDYNFPGADYVDEFPQMQKKQEGGEKDKVKVIYIGEDERSYYDPVIDTVYLSESDRDNEHAIAHELAHAWQNRHDELRIDPLSPKQRPSIVGSDALQGDYYNRKGDDVRFYDEERARMFNVATGLNYTPEMDFINSDVWYDKFTDNALYANPYTMEGEAEERATQWGRPPLELEEEQDGGFPLNTSGPMNTLDPDWRDGMIKGRMATAAHFGNPSAQRMVTLYPKLGTTPEGIGSHYMSSVDNYAVPHLQDRGNPNLDYSDMLPPPSSEDMMFNTPEEADYFALNYKRFAPMMWNYNKDAKLNYQEGGNYIEAELDEKEIEEYRKGGFIVEEVSMSELTKAQTGLSMLAPPDLRSTQQKIDQVKGSPYIKDQQQAKLLYAQKAKEDFEKTAFGRSKIVDERLRDAKIKDQAIIVAQQEFEKKEQKAYDEQTSFGKGLGQFNAFIADPLATGANWLSGERALVDQHEILRDPTHPDYAAYVRATGADSWLNQGVNMFNPAAWAADAHVDLSKGNYGSAAFNIGAGILGGTGLKEIAKSGAKGLIRASDNINTSKQTGLLSRAPIFQGLPDGANIGFSLPVSKTHEIKNLSTLEQMVNQSSYAPAQKKYLQNVLNSIKKQDNLASDRQFEITQRIKTGDFNWGKKGYSLTSKEILDLPEKEILFKTGMTKEDWNLFIKHQPVKYEKSLEETFNSAYTPTIKQLENVDKGKQQLLDFYGSADYNRRLQLAPSLKLDFMEAHNYQKNLIDAINKTEPRFVQSKKSGSLESDAMAYTKGADSSGTKLGIDFSDRGLNRADASYLASHEFGHTSIYDIKNQKLLENLPKLDLDQKVLKDWTKWGYEDRIRYHSNPDEARQRGLNTILYSKNTGISLDEIVDMPYDLVVAKNRAGELPNDVLELRQLYNQSQLKEYLKKLYIAAPIATGVGAASQQGETTPKLQRGGSIEAELTQKEIDKLISQGYIVEEVNNINEMQFGGIPSEAWQKATGTPWAEAQNRNLTTGSAEDNLAFLKRINQGEFTKSVLQSPKINILAKDAVLTSTDKLNIKNAKTFNEAFAIARETLGANHIFNYAGKEYGTNIAGEDFKPSQESLTRAGLNTNSVKNNLDKQNKQIADPYLSKSIVKLQQDPYISWDKVKERNLEINKSNNADKIIQSKSTVKTGKNYIIIDKQKGLMHIYQPGNSKPLFTSAIDLGASKSDAQTVTKIKDTNNDGIIDSYEAMVGKADFDLGNKTTGAGKYYISNIDRKGYQGLPLLNMMNEKQHNEFLKTGKIENVATSLHKGYIADDQSRVSNGCIRCNKTSLDNLVKYMSNSSEVYILPEDEGNEFVYENGQLNFKTTHRGNFYTYKDNKKIYKKENNDWYIANKPGEKMVKINEQSRITELNKNAVNARYNYYIDSKGSVQKGQGINTGTNTLKYAPIKTTVNETTFKKDKFTNFDFTDEEEYEKVKTFAKSLETNKQKVMDAAQINGDVYNEIAKMAFGIFGTESNFADTHGSGANFGRAINKWWDPQESSSPDYHSKYYTYGAKKNTQSVGLTQIRWSYLNADEKKALAKVGITNNVAFMNPEKAALGTAVVLGIRYNQQLTALQKKDIWKHLPAKWNTRANYPARVRNSSVYLNIMEKV